MQNSNQNSWNSQKWDFENYLKTLKYHSFLNFDFRTKVYWDLFVELFEKSPELKTELLKLAKMRFLKTNWNFWSTAVLWILILEQSVFELNCSNIQVESRILNRTLGTFENEIFKNYLKTLKWHNFLDFEFRTKFVGTCF